MISKQVFKMTVIAILGLACESSRAEEVIFFEGFNSGFSEPNLYTGTSTFAQRFGAVSPNIVLSPDNGQLSTEGDSFCGLNNVRTDTSGAGALIGRGSVNLGMVSAAGVTYTFTGDFSWRYSEGGMGGAVQDLYMGAETGLQIGNVKVSTQVDFNFSDFAEGTWNEYTFRYTTFPSDIGKNIEFWIDLVHSH